jgi:hypothetical protein
MSEARTLTNLIGNGVATVASRPPRCKRSCSVSASLESVTRSASSATTRPFGHASAVACDRARARPGRRSASPVQQRRATQAWYSPPMSLPVSREQPLPLASFRLTGLRLWWLIGQRFRPQIDEIILAVGHRIDLGALRPHARLPPTCVSDVTSARHCAVSLRSGALDVIS